MKRIAAAILAVLAMSCSANAQSFPGLAQPNQVVAGPPSGSTAAPPGLRSLVPADLPQGTNSAIGGVKCDGTTTSCSAGVVTAVGASANAVDAGGATSITNGVATDCLYDNSAKVGNLPCAPSVANNTALLATCTASSGCPGGDPVLTGGVWRLTYGNGNGAEPLFYSPSGSACTITSFTGSISGTTLTTSGGAPAIGQFIQGTGVTLGTKITAGSGTSWTISASQTVGSEAMTAGDGGIQVPSADGKCWTAQFPAAGASIKQFGAFGDAFGSQHDDTAVVQLAVNDLPGNGFRILVPSAAYCLSTGPVVIPATPTGGFATNIVGYSNQSSDFTDCNHDVALFKWEGSGGGMSDIGLFCRGSASTDTFSFTQPCLYIHGGSQSSFWNLNIQGGLYTVFIDSGNSDRFYNLYAYNAYANNVLLQGGSNIHFDHSTLDQSWPVVALTSANISSFSSWASGQAYAANSVVKIHSVTEGLDYLVQCSNCNGIATSSGSAPALKSYGGSMNNGSDSLNWQLVAPVNYIGVDCDTACGELYVTDTDLAGPYLDNVAMSNSLSGTAPNGMFLKNITTSFNTGTAVSLSAGSFVEVDGGSISGCAVTGCAAVQTSGTYSGVTSIYGVQVTGTTHGVVDGAGTQLTVGSSVFSTATDCFLAQNSVTKFSVTNNQCVNVGGIITVNSGSDFFSIVGNITGASTENANVTNNGGAHSSVHYNW